MQFIRIVGISVLTIALFSCGNKVEHELKVTVAQVKGKCLFSDNWVSVSGEYVYWKIDNHIEHEHRLIPISRESLSTTLNQELSVFDDPIYFEVMGGYWITKDTKYLDLMRKKFKNENLELATTVLETSQGDLYYLNKLNPKNPFGKSSESTVFIPLGRTTCDLEKNYIMKNSYAIYTKSLFGKVTFKKNETIPYKPGKRTFAEELIDLRG